ncbi:PREDICTED: uncharacterized protein LOC108757418 [Trachymyrmex cornetzi]|uniref:uncharacterized protein LOC108757418 n=1 Tax=Trachymyrmex cornetzi TaxID=471704 RepID=UPI00084F36A0|nr:PREDICTED: uncharacterized protein LOC108757418 [Trachymyrmex cornetzi]
MEKFEQVKTIANNFKTSSKKAVQALHTLIFEQEGDRENRKRLREFRGFLFAINSEEYKSKIAYVESNLIWADLVSVCNILAIEYSGTKRELSQRLCDSLIDLNSLNSCDESDKEENAGDSDIQEQESSESDEDAKRRSRKQDSKDVKRRTRKTKYKEVAGEDEEDKNEDEEDKNEDEEDEVAEDQNEDENDQRSVETNPRVTNAKFTMTFRDVEDSIRHYNGDDKYPMERWIMDIEEAAELFGLAKLFIQGERGITSWEKLKKALKEKFSQKMNSAELHKLLSKRKIKKDESVQVYYLVMEEIASRGNIEDEALYCYIVDGIEDSTINKNILYGAKNAKEFKEKLKVYEKIKAKSTIPSKSTNISASKKTKPKDKEATRCYNCGELGHRASECDSRSKGMKCFNCNEFGHKATECKKEKVKGKKEEETTIMKTESVNSRDPPKNMYKIVEMRKEKVNALIDTGSQFTIINEKVYGKTGSPELTISTILFSGFGKREVKPMGYFEDIIAIDNESFQSVVYVVPDDVMSMEAVIGNELLSQAELKVGPEGISITKIHEDMVFPVNYVTEEEMQDTSHIICREKRKEVEHLIADYQPRKVKNADIEMTITVNDDRKVTVRPRRLPFHERKIVDEQVEQWIKDKIVEPFVKDHSPLPLIDDILDRLQDARVFSSIDLKNGFFHVPVREHDRVDEEDAINNLKLVLKRAEEYGLEINKKKCQLLQRRIEFLGYIIEDAKLYPSTEKTRAVLRFPEPQTTKEVQSFLGITGYFRKFIPNYSRIAKPLSDLLKKDAAFQFKESERNAFTKLKRCLAEEPVLNIYNHTYETEVHTDASQDGFGAVLLQRSPSDNELHPIYFMSKKTSDAERKFSSYELEALAVVETLKKFRVYLLGKSFKVVTDCSALQQTMRKKDLIPRIARWVLYLQDFDFTMERRSGSRMTHVDALSRYPVMTVFNHDVTPKIKRAQEADKNIQIIKQRLEEASYEGYHVLNSVVYKQEKGYNLLMIPKSLQDEIIRRAHEQGHFAAKRTEEKLKQEYYIPDLRTKVEKCITNCIKCILVNKKPGKKEGFLHPLTKEDVPLHTYHIDHLGPLESTNKNYKHILAVIDSFTKFVWMYPVKSTTSKEVIEKLELQKNIFGNPTCIISEEQRSQPMNLKIIVVKRILNILRLQPIAANVKFNVPTQYKYHSVRIINRSQDENAGRKMKDVLEQEMINDFENSRQQLRNEARKQIEKVQQENQRQYNLRRRPPFKYKLDDLVAIKRTQLGPGLKLKPNYLGPYRIVKVKPNDTYDVIKEGHQE